jgi:hypothetical protein
VAACLCFLCALVLAGVAARGADAAILGTTAFTCKEVGEGGSFTRLHRRSFDAGKGNFSHVAIAQEETTEVIGSNANTNESTTGPVVSRFSVTIAVPGGIAPGTRS